MSMFGKMSVGVVTIDVTPSTKIKIAATIKVYGRLSASRTIHILHLHQKLDPNSIVRYLSNYSVPSGGLRWSSSSWTSDQPSGIACCSSKRDSRFLRSTATRACEPSGATLRYWTGHEIGCPNSRAARNGQYGSRR